MLLKARPPAGRRHASPPQLLCFDDAFAAKMEPKQPPGELRQIGCLAREIPGSWEHSNEETMKKMVKDGMKSITGLRQP
jgi:hypothetical protein